MQPFHSSWYGSGLAFFWSRRDLGQRQGAASSPEIRDGDAVVIRIPMQLKSRRGRKEIIVPEGLS